MTQSDRLSAPESAPPSQRFWPLMLALFAVALALRYWGIARASLWLDEVLQLNCTTLPLRQMWQCFPADKPPLDYAIQWLFLRAGNGEATARFHACLFGALLVPAFALLGRRMTPQGSFALVLPLVALANPLLIRFSQEGRPYALLLLAETLFLATLWNAIQAGRDATAKPPGPRVWIALAAALLLCLWTHYLALFGALTGLGLGLVIWAVQRPKAFTRRDAALAGGLLAAVALSALPLWWRAQRKDPSEFFAGFQLDSLGMTGVYLDIYTMGYEWWEFLRGARWLFVGLAVVGWAGWAFGRADRRAAAHFCLLHFLICFFGPFAAYWKANHWMEMRYTLAAMPTALALMAMGLEVLGRGIARLLRRPESLVPAVALAVLLVGGNVAYRARHPFLRSDWRELGRRIDREARSGAVVVVGKKFNSYGIEFYLRRHGLDIPVVDANNDPEIHRRLREEGRDVWSVVEGYMMPPDYAAEREHLPPLEPPIYGIDVRHQP